MLTTKRKPATVGEILVEEFMRPLGLTQGELADAMGVPRKHVNQLCNDRRAITAPTALILARVRRQPGFLAQRAAPHRPLGGAAFAPRNGAHRAHEAVAERGLSSPTEAHGMRKRESTRTNTANDLKAMRCRSEDRTDWTKVDAMTEADLEWAIAEDEDERDLDPDWTRAKPVISRPCQSVHLRFEPEVIDWTERVLLAPLRCLYCRQP